MYQKESKQSERKDTVFKTKERESKQSARRDPVLGQRKLYIRRNQSNLQEKTLSLKQKKVNQSILNEKTLSLRQRKSARITPVLGLKKSCIKRNQSREREKIILLKHRKKYARMQKPEDQWSYKLSPDYWPGITTKMKKLP